MTGRSDTGDGPLWMPDDTERSRNGRPLFTHERSCDALEHEEHEASECPECGCCWGCDSDCCAEWFCPNDDCGCSKGART